MLNKDKSLSEINGFDSSEGREEISKKQKFKTEE